MPVGKKILWIIIILGSTVVSYFVILSLMPFFRDTAAIAVSAPSASNFTSLVDFCNAWPWLLLVIPGGCGLIASVMVMRQREANT